MTTTAPLGSSYLEGDRNELAAFGYHRDKKSGQRQIVIELLGDGEGCPLSIEVFPGNPRNPATVAAQIRKLAGRFGGGEVTLVGDRGRLKSRETRDLLNGGFHYLTAITKPQINSRLKKGVFQMSLFDQKLAEVEAEPGIRYLLRRNPVRAGEIESTRRSNLASLRAAAEKQNAYLKEHPRAGTEIALRKLRERGAKLKLGGWLSPALEGRRPVHGRKESRTRGRALVVRLAYRIVQELAARWRGLDLTVEEGLRKLETLCDMEASLDGGHWLHRLPEPRPELRELLELAGVSLPEILPHRKIRVSTRKKLTTRRKSR